MSIPPRSLHTRISLLLTGLAAILLMVLASLWVHGMRSSIHEYFEKEASIDLTLDKCTVE